MRLTLPLIIAGALGAPQGFSVPPPPGPSSEIPDRREFPLNKEISPCENFYEHACSSVISSFRLPDDRKAHTFAFSDSRERILERKKTFLRDLDLKFKKKEKLSERSETLATVYGACMNPTAAAAEEREIVANTIKAVQGIKTRKEFLAFLEKERRESQGGFVDIGSTANQDRPELYDFAFGVNMMTLPERSYYLKPEVASDYQKVVEGFFKTVGDKAAPAKAKRVVELETAFAKVAPLPAEMREIYTRKSSISKSDILKKYPSFALEKDLALVPDGVNIRHIVPETYAFVEKRLQKDKLEDLKAFYIYQHLAPKMDDAYPEYFNQRFEFRQKHLGESKVRPDREERCTNMVMSSFNKEIDAELLPLMFPDFPEEKFIALAEKVRGSIIDGVKSNQWLSAEGKKGAIEKISKAKLHLVKPRNEEEWYFNPPATYAIDKPIANSNILEKVRTERMFKELGTMRNRDRWAMGPLTVNAYYSPSDNKFVMPIGILQYPFYDPSLPVEVNLGAVGAVIGHELGHGIDDQGAKYDSEGKLRQWMSEVDVKGFQERGRKFIDQFNQIGHNGELTLGENIGDLTGVTFAYNAAFPEGKGTPEQKRNFFLQYARVWCGIELPKVTEQMLKVGPHSRGWARVNQQMKNQPPFAEAFSCKKGDAMVLDEKDIVRIW